MFVLSRFSSYETIIYLLKIRQALNFLQFQQEHLWIDSNR